MEQTLEQSVAHNDEVSCSTSMAVKGVAEANHGLVDHQDGLFVTQNAILQILGTADKSRDAQVQLQDSNRSPAATPQHTPSTTAEAGVSAAAALAAASLEPTPGSSISASPPAAVCVVTQAGDTTHAVALQQSHPCKRHKTAVSAPSGHAGETSISPTAASTAGPISAAAGLEPCRNPAAVSQHAARPSPSPSPREQQEQQQQQSATGSVPVHNLQVSPKGAVAENSKAQQQLQDMQHSDLKDIENRSSSPSGASLGEDAPTQTTSLKRQRSSSISSDDFQEQSKQVAGSQVRRGQTRAASVPANAAAAAAAAVGLGAAGTGYRGIILRRNGRYDGRLTVLGVKLYLGVFENPADAAAAYDLAALALYDESAAINFPRSNYSAAAVAARRAELLDKLKNHQNVGGSQAGQQARQWAAAQLEKDQLNSSTGRDQQQQQAPGTLGDSQQQEQQYWEPAHDPKGHLHYSHGRTQAVGRARAAAVAAAAAATKANTAVPSSTSAGLLKKLDIISNKPKTLQGVAASKKPRLAAAVAAATSELQKQGSGSKSRSKVQQHHQQQQQQSAGVYAAHRSDPVAAAADDDHDEVSEQLLESLWGEYCVHPSVLDGLLCLIDAAACLSPSKGAVQTHVYETAGADDTAAADDDTDKSLWETHTQQQHQQHLSAAAAVGMLQCEEPGLPASPAISDFREDSPAVIPAAAALPSAAMVANHHHKQLFGHMCGGSSSGTRGSHSSSSTPARFGSAAAVDSSEDDTAMHSQQQHVSRKGRTGKSRFAKAAAAAAAGNSESAAAAAAAATAAARVIGFAAALVSPKKSKGIGSSMHKPAVNKTASIPAGAAAAAAATTGLVDTAAAAAGGGGNVKVFGPGCVSHAQNPTGQMGVRSRKGRFEAFVATPPFRYLYLGQYDRVDDAVLARDGAMLALYGPTAAAAHGSAWLSPGAAAAARVQGSRAAAAVVEMAKKLVKKEQVLAVVRDQGTDHLLHGVCQQLYMQQQRAQAAAVHPLAASAAAIAAGGGATTMVLVPT